MTYRRVALIVVVCAAIAFAAAGMLASASLGTDGPPDPSFATDPSAYPNDVPLFGDDGNALPCTLPSSQAARLASPPDPTGPLDSLSTGNTLIPSETSVAVPSVPVPFYGFRCNSDGTAERAAPVVGSPINP